MRPHSASEARPITFRAVSPLPGSIAIAGIHGPAGRRIYDAALDAGVARIYGCDARPRPGDFRSSDRLRMVTDAQFHELDADLFHVATEPEQRQVGRLLERGRRVNVATPMAHPAHPDQCHRLREAARRGPGTARFDFAGVLGPRALQLRAMLAALRRHADFRITRVRCESSRDREDPRNPLNRATVAPIQYQETASCLALLLFVMDRGASFAEAFPEGMSVAALSAPYDPPNPEDYRYGAVDGKVSGEIRANGMTVDIHTDFKRRGVRRFKRFGIEGVAGGREFRIESIADGLSEQMLLDGNALPLSGMASRHQCVIRQSWSLHHGPVAGVRPDADFAWLVFGMSAALWASCHEGREIRIWSEDDLREAMQAYPDSLGKRARYPAPRWYEQIGPDGPVTAAPVCRNSML